VDDPMLIGESSQRGDNLLGLIPHRPPFLLIDEVVEIDENRIVTSRFVDPESDFFRGHYPGEPIMPGVLICESIFQSGALLIAHRMGGSSVDGSANDGVPVLTRIRDARFKRIVRPGETMFIEVVLDDAVERAFNLTGTARVDGELSVRVSFGCMLARKDGAA